MGGDIDLSDPNKPTLKYLKNIRTVLGTQNDLYFVCDLHNGIESAALHFHADSLQLELGYGTISNELNNPDYTDDDLLNDLKLSDFIYCDAINGNNTVTANGSYRDTSGYFVFYVNKVNRQTFPTIIQFIAFNPTDSHIWFMNSTPLAMHGNTWISIKSKIDTGQDFTSDITSFIRSYTLIK